MENFYLLNFPLGIGLSNQLGYIIGAIIIAKASKKRFVVVSDFNRSLDGTLPCSISNILDLETLNKISSSHGVYVIEKSKAFIEIVSIRYGIPSKSFDITKYILELYKNDKMLRIPSTICFNDIAGDPIQYLRKNIYITYKVNNILETVLYPEKLKEDILFDLYFQNNPEQLHMCWISTYNINLYNKILQDIVFTPIFYEIVDFYINKINIDKNKDIINTIHLRDEDDAIKHWSYINRMSPELYKNKIQEKYKILVRKYFEKNSKIIVLTSNYNSELFSVLNEYDYYLCDKRELIDNFFEQNKKYNAEEIYIYKSLLKGREVDAIIDLLIGLNCNNIFIASVYPDPENFHGSSFSYVLLKRLKNHSKSVFFDMDFINKEEFLSINNNNKD